MRKRILTAIVIFALAGAVFGAMQLHKLAFIGSAYAAQQTCACLFVSNRALESCRHDLDPLAQKLVTLEPGDKAVHARSLLSSATARFEPAFGCSIEN
jgi:hypothetical protein